MTTKTIDERVNRIEKIFWVVGVVAVIFGVSGAWGLNALNNAKSKIDKLNVSIETVIKDNIDNARLALENEKDKQVADFNARIQKEMSDQLAMAKNEISNILKTRVYEYNKQGPKITSLIKHANVKLPVKKGDVIYASYVASARNSEFYYRIIASKSGIAQPLINRDQCVMVASIDRHQWHSISASEVFEVHKSGELDLAVDLKKGSLSGKVEIFSPTLVAFKVASGS